MFIKKLNLLVLATLIFVGCVKDEEELPLKSNIITAKVEKGKDYASVFSSVKVFIYYYDTYVDGHYTTIEGNCYEAASSDYIDGGFSLTLPETLESRCVVPLADVLWYDSGVKVSNISTRGIEITIKGYDKDGVFVDDFECRRKSNKNVSGRFIYVDRDVTITDSDNRRIFNLNLKKGWNMYFYKDNGYGYKSNIFSKTDEKDFQWYRSKDL